jgi:hypothetical protein
MGSLKYRAKSSLFKFVGKQAHNPKVTGSNPVPATTNNIKGLDHKSKPFLFSLFTLFPTLFPT